MPERRSNSPLLIALLAIVFLTASAIENARAANTLEQLLMPGPVVTSHAKVENKCEACHTPFSKATQDNLCLDCHKPIKADIESRTGFHGRSPLLKGVACNLCHDDHKGRDADIIQLDTATFNHAATDYPLTGAHRDVLCTDCHVTGKRWAEAPGTCFGCHQADEPHRGHLGKECQSCHRDTAWRDTIAFDHAKTRFPLRGKHVDVPCLSCHLGEMYKGVAMACNDCHALQDVHRQRFGTACQSCHKETTWKEAKFDHAKTQFPLAGAHAKAECKTCHGQNVLERIASVCFGCHEKQDVHKTQLGKQCGDCHSDVSWRKKVVFDHGLTKFPLTGLHAVVACEDCHSSAAFKDTKIACADCHAREDVHAGRFTTRCEACHTANGWMRVQFDHGRQTKFPLTGKHATTGCYNCHMTKNVTDASLPTSCFSCHARDDVHRGKFGKDCGRCHGTASFSTAIIKP